jgi:hypothetical protein
MEEMFVPVFLILMLVTPIVSFVWQFRRIRRGLTSRLKGIALYAGCSAVPVLAYVGLFFALVGAEEILDTSLIGEGYARSLVILGGGGLAWVALGTIIFSIVVLFVQSKKI